MNRNKIIFKSFLICLLCIFSERVIAQQNKVDSVINTLIISLHSNKLDTNSFKDAYQIALRTSFTDNQINQLDSVGMLLINKYPKEKLPYTVLTADFIYLINKDAAKAIAFGKLQIEKFDKIHSPVASYIKGGYLKILRIPFRNSTMLEEGFRYYTQKLNDYKIKKDSVGLASCYYVLAGFYNITGITDLAIYNIKKSISYIDTISNKEEWINNTGVIGHYYLQKGNQQECLKYSRLSYLERLKQKTNYSVISLVMAKLFLLRNEPDSAAYYINISKQDPYLKINLDFFSFLLQTESLYNIHIGNLDTAEALLIKCQQLIKEKNIPVNAAAGTIAPDYYFALIRIKQNKFDDAIALLYKDIERLLNNRLDKLRDYKLIAELYEKTRQHDKAAETYASYVAMKDSLLADQDKYRSYSFEAEQQMNEKELAITNLESENKIVSLSRNFSIGIAGLLLLLAGVFFWQRKKTEKEKQRTVAEKKRSDQLLLNILPSEVAEELKEKGNAEARHFDEVSVLFTDFIDFTKLSEQLSPQVLVQELHECFSAFDAIMERNGLEKIKTVGDAYIAVCGLPVANKLHAEKAVQAALEIRQFMEARKKQEKVFDIRIGIHSGPVVAGIVGVKKFAYDIWGDTVNTSARMEQSSEAGKINISETTYALVKDKFSCAHRGKIAAKGKGEIDMYFVEK